MNTEVYDTTHCGPTQMSIDLNSLAQKAAVVVSRQVGRSVVLATPQLLKDKTRSLIVRCTVQDAGWTAGATTDRPAAVIIKYMRDNPQLGFSEWASLAYLATLPAAHTLVPRFLGGDVDERFFVMTDLGDGQSLEAILQRKDKEVALATLRDLAICMARLHAATLITEETTEEAFATIRHRLPDAAGLGRQTEAAHWRQQAPKMMQWFAAAAVPLPAGFMACLQRIADLYACPGPFLAFTHGDPAPSNNHIGAKQVHLVDFEYGDFRHALYDITGWSILCPLPAACVQMMKDAFQAELAILSPAVRDPVQYTQAWAMMCAFRALALLTWLPLETLHTNQPWVDTQWTSRHAVLAAMARLHEGTTQIAELAPLCEAAAGLAQALGQRWPEFANCRDLSPQWPVFAGA